MHSFVALGYESIFEHEYFVTDHIHNQGMFWCRLLPYHIVAEYEPDDVEVSTSESGVPVSRSQAWKESLESKSSDFMRMLDKQINTFNTIMRRRAEGDMRGEERLLVEKWLLVDERQKLADARAQVQFLPLLKFLMLIKAMIQIVGLLVVCIVLSAFHFLYCNLLVDSL